MIYKSEEEILLLVRRFEDKTLPKTDWTHAAHLTVGLYYCFHNSFELSKSRMTEGIYRLNEAHGTPNTDSSGYHETITLFWLATIADFLEKNREEKSLMRLTNALLAFYDDTKLPLRFYSRERLFSVEARREYVEPDLEPFSAEVSGLLFAPQTAV